MLCISLAPFERAIEEKDFDVVIRSHLCNAGCLQPAGALAPLSLKGDLLAAIDIAGFVTDLKDHGVDHGFHIHDERHFIETYSLSQSWEIVMHPEEACGGYLDLHAALEIDPRILLAFEDHLIERSELVEEPDDEFQLNLFFNWGLPPLRQPPDLLVLSTELAGVGGLDLPLEISAIDSFAAVTDAPERRLGIVGSVQVSLANLSMGREQLCRELDLAHKVSLYLAERATAWIE